MKILSILLSASFLLSACSKGDTRFEQPDKDPFVGFPEMLVTELNDAEVTDKKSFSLDIDHDGTKDFAFATWYIGNPNQQEDELLFFAASGISSSLMVGAENNSPRFAKNETIFVTPVPGYDWYIVSQVELAMKNIGMSGDPYWEKEWRTANHSYLAVNVKRDGKIYCGWVELSMDTENSKLILHRAAISKAPGRAVKVGI